MYPLLPTMQGANAALLIQAIGELKTRYEGTELSHRLLWLRTLLERAKSIPDDDKKAVEKEIDMFDELLDEDPYLLERDAHVAQEAELRILRTMITRIVQRRFPNLTVFAQSKVAQIENSEKLQTLVEQVAVTPDEDFTRKLLDISAAT